MLIPHIMFHNQGKVVDETAELFENYYYEVKKGSFFQELTASNLPTYFEFHEYLIEKDKFFDYDSHDYNKSKNE